MNFSSAVMLFNKNIRAVATIYDLEPLPGNGVSKTPMRTIYKTLDPAIVVGDLVIIPTDTRYKMSVVKVVETDVEVDYDSPAELKWIIGTIDRLSYDKVLKMEAQAIEMIRSAEKRRKREELAASILKDNPELAQLSIAGVSADVLDLPAPSEPQTK